MRVQMRPDGALQLGDGGREPSNVGVEAFHGLGIESVGAARLFGSAHLHKRVAAAMQAGEALAGRVGSWLAPQGQTGAHGRQQAGVERVGLGALTQGLRKGASAGGVDAGVRDGGAGKGLTQRRIIGAAGLEDDQVLGAEGGDQFGDRPRLIGDAPGLAARGVVEVEMMLGDVDSDDVMR